MLLEPLPGIEPTRILVGGCVLKDPDILAVSLASLERQILPPNVALTPCFVDDNVSEESTAVLKDWLERNHGIYLDGRSGAQDFAEGGVTHQWSVTAMQRVGQFKNQIIRETLSGRYAALWLVDTDLVLSPRTFWSLYHTDAPIACGVFWTKWQDVPECPPMPQVWLRHPYELNGRGWDMPDFLHALMEHQRVQVWGQGACSLYRADVLQKGVSFEPVAELPKEGMWAGEDRHLCTRAERLHVPMYADAWPDILHVYHPRQRAQIADFLAEGEPPGSPKIGDWVSLHLHALEPVPADAGMVHLEKHHARGRLGRLRLVDDLEDAVQTMTRGETKIVSATFPPWSPATMYRGQQRLIEVTLLDWRHHRAPGSL